MFLFYNNGVLRALGPKIDRTAVTARGALPTSEPKPKQALSFPSTRLLKYVLETQPHSHLT